MRLKEFIITLAVSLLVAGCATTERTPPPRLTGNPAVDAPTLLTNGRSRDKVLWQYRTAAAAMHRGQFEEAKRLLDDAISTISGIIGQDAEARKARGYFSPEARKTFIGEPYERVMAYYYRGILYWMDGEPDNARACFRSALFEDSDTLDKKYAADYVLLDYLDGLASVKLAGDGSDALKRAQLAVRISMPGSYNRNANLLLFVEFGPGPTKFAAGRHGEHLMFQEHPCKINVVQLQIAGKTYQVRAYDDLHYQATTRGGRVMDHILANKATFKDTTDIAGDAAIVSGVVLAHNRDTQPIALGAIALGIFSKIASASTRADADTRSWDNLPLYLSFAHLDVPPGDHAVTVDFLDEGNRVISGLTKQMTINVPPNGESKVVYVSDKSTTPQNL
jgi:tetratricopeptide (TPR) repeat protein